jgi:uncharacterized membrane protein YccC
VSSTIPTPNEEAQQDADIAAVKATIARLREAYEDASERMRAANDRLQRTLDAVRNERPWAIPGLTSEAVERLAEWSGWGIEATEESD